MTAIHIAVQTADFHQADEYHALAQGASAGAVVTFVGRVRAFDGAAPLHLEHYPGMTERVLRELAEAASERFELLATRIIHRVGSLPPGEQIVFVGTAAAHRAAAFAATEFLIDRLKTEAPFWKREGAQWVEAQGRDQERSDRWL